MLSLNNEKCLKQLGLREGASIADIKMAYRNLALKYHPDKNKSVKYNEKFKLITEAYQTLRVNYERDTGQNPSIKYNDIKSAKKHDLVSRKLFLDFCLNVMYNKKPWNVYLKRLENTYQDLSKYESTIKECYKKAKKRTTLLVRDIIT